MRGTQRDFRFSPLRNSRFPSAPLRFHAAFDALFQSKKEFLRSVGHESSVHEKHGRHEIGRIISVPFRVFRGHTSDFFQSL